MALVKVKNYALLLINLSIIIAFNATQSSSLVCRYAHAHISKSVNWSHETESKTSDDKSKQNGR